jgi:hypothetical protein
VFRSAALLTDGAIGQCRRQAYEPEMTRTSALVEALSSVTESPASFATNRSPPLGDRASGSSNLYDEAEITRTSVLVEVLSSVTVSPSALATNRCGLGLRSCQAEPSHERAPKPSGRVLAQLALSVVPRRPHRAKSRREDVPGPCRVDPVAQSEPLPRNLRQPGWRASKTARKRTRGIGEPMLRELPRCWEGNPQPRADDVVGV